MAVFLLFVLPLLICIAPLIAGTILKKKEKKTAEKICLFVGFFCLTALACYFLRMETYSFSAFSENINLAFPLVCFALLVISLILILFSCLKKPVKAAALTIALLFTVGGLTGMELYQHGYYDKHPPIAVSDNTEDYRPYLANSKVAVLDGESTLKLTEELPVMDGATALYPVYAAFAKAVYPESSIAYYSLTGYEHPDGRAPLVCYKTKEAYERVVAGDADIIFVAAPSNKQRQAAEKAGVELVFTPIGKEAFVFFVNAENPLNDISLADIRNIYAGKLTHWKELGVKMPGKIIAFQRSEGSGSQSALQRLMGDTPLAPAPKDREILDMGGIIESVGDYRNFKNAIGFSFRFYATEMVNGEDVKLLSVNGAAPTAENIANGTYPISEPFYAVTRSDAGENTKKLLEWILSEQGQKLIEKTGYVGIGMAG